MFYCENMFENIKIYTADKYWRQILTDLGAVIVDSQNGADLNFDDIDISGPISVIDLKNLIFDYMDDTEIICNIFGKNQVLPSLQHKIIVLLYKNPNMTMHDLKEALGVMPNMATHTVENAIYQLRKTYGHDFIQNIGGTYKIGRL